MEDAKPLFGALLNAIETFRAPSLDHDVRRAADLIRLLVLIPADDPDGARLLVDSARPAVDQIIVEAEARMAAMDRDHTLVRPSLDYAMRVVLHLQIRCGVDLGVDTRTWPAEDRPALENATDAVREFVSAGLAAIARYCLTSDARR